MGSKFIFQLVAISTFLVVMATAFEFHCNVDEDEDYCTPFCQRHVPAPVDPNDPAVEAYVFGRKIAECVNSPESYPDICRADGEGNGPCCCCVHGFFSFICKIITAGGQEVKGSSTNGTIVRVD